MPSAKRKRLLGLLRDLTRPREIGRLAYLSIGVILFAAKYSIDQTISQSMFGATWTWKYYLFHGAIPRPKGLPWHRDEGALLGVLFLVALPFIYLGIRLTLARLRSAALPLWLALMFFAPRAEYSFLCAVVGDSAKGTRGR